MRTSQNLPPVVGIEIHGGMGNQLFQYAAAYALAKRRNADLRLDTYLIRKGARRPLVLDRFGVTWVECRHPEARGALRAIGRSFGYGRDNPFRDAVLRENRYDYMPELAETRLPAFLVGYFQSWRYFDGAEDDLRQLLDVSRFENERTSPLASQIRHAKNPVAVHVRRGDYASDPSALAVHGLLDSGYYERARGGLMQRRGEISYFVYSDDAGAAQALLGHWPNVTFVSGFSDLEDLFLMSLAKDFIIANSTFSWWAAWLGRKADGTVVAPKDWFAEPARATRPTTDLYPDNWLVL